MTKLEKAFTKMTPEKRKQAVNAISEMMGMPNKKKKTAAKKPVAKKK